MPISFAGMVFALNMTCTCIDAIIFLSHPTLLIFCATVFSAALTAFVGYMVDRRE